MGEELLKKKILIEAVPVFNHGIGSVEEAIGIKGIVETVGHKLQIMENNVTITSPSKAVEYIYNSFNKAELSFLLMHLMSHEVENDLTKEGESK